MTPQLHSIRNFNGRLVRWEKPGEDFIRWRFTENTLKILDGVMTYRRWGIVKHHSTVCVSQEQGRCFLTIAFGVAPESTARGREDAIWLQTGNTGVSRFIDEPYKMRPVLLAYRAFTGGSRKAEIRWPPVLFVPLVAKHVLALGCCPRKSGSALKRSVIDVDIFVVAEKYFIIRIPLD